MRPSPHARWVLLGGALLVGPVFGQAPSSDSATPCASTTSKPCPAAAHKPSVAEQFPYPGTAAPANASAGSANSPAPSADAPGSTTPADAGRLHPFPGTPVPDQSSSSSSSSSTPNEPGAAANDPNAGPDTPDPAPPPRRRKLAKVNAQSDDERADEDLDVAHYYFGRGNYTAAYLRSKDAIKAQPDDPEAHLAVAQAAQKLNKRDEAIDEYKHYLLLEPDGDKAKAAKKALSSLK